jgi:hypothetical protein
MEKDRHATRGLPANVANNSGRVARWEGESFSTMRLRRLLGTKGMPDHGAKQLTSSIVSKEGVPGSFQALKDMPA